MNSQKININSDYESFKKVFLLQNAKLNLISKNEEKFLFEKHFYDSLSIKLFFEKYNLLPDNILDFGTGGGFPAVPVAMEFPQIKVVGLDSIRKKINAVDNIKEELQLKNLSIICDRAENIKNKKFDVVTSRAVAKISLLAGYVSKILKENGYFVAYKSKTAEEELQDAKNILKQNKLKFIESIEYTLPLEEVYERKLLIFQKTT